LRRWRNARAGNQSVCVTNGERVIIVMTLIVSLMSIASSAAIAYRRSLQVLALAAAPGNAA
jgi:hypothetical protein